MSEPTIAKTCPHCGGQLDWVRIPDEAGFEEPLHLVCFSDECPYYVRGWTWMEEKFGVHSSYRYRVNPRTGCSSPISVWSENALKSHIVSDDETPEGSQP